MLVSKIYIALFVYLIVRTIKYRWFKSPLKILILYLSYTVPKIKRDILLNLTDNASYVSFGFCVQETFLSMAVF